MDKTPSEELELPGFRFHPTEEELLSFYLRRKVVQGEKLNFDIIGTLNLYSYHPSELPGLATIGEREWYFFVPRDRKHANGGRPNRTTEHGFWKATGSDRHIRSVSDPKRMIGLRKTLVFYNGRAPRGCKTDWVMNEYRMPDSFPLPKEDIVLCKIYRKATSLKVLEQRAAMGEEKSRAQDCVHPTNTESSSEIDNCQTPIEVIDDKRGIEQKSEGLSLQVGPMKENLTELQLPKFGSEWTLDPFFRSPWLENWGHYANILNF